MSSLLGFLALLVELQGTLARPQLDDHSLEILTPRLLELRLVSTDASLDDEAIAMLRWDFLELDQRRENTPELDAFRVQTAGRALPVVAIGFKRHPIYAPLNDPDLQVETSIFLLLGDTIPDGGEVRVTDVGGDYLNGLDFSAVNTADRVSRAIHVNQVGFVPGFTGSLPGLKQGFVSLYLGDLGVTRVDPSNGEWVVDVIADASTGTFTGETFPLGVNVGAGFSVINTRDNFELGTFPLRERQDDRWVTYRSVFEADFSEVVTPGWYQLRVPGMGLSLPFRIDQDVAATFARTLALGVYHQRSAQDHALPYTRFIDGPGHTAAAYMPFDSVQEKTSYEMMARESDSFFAEESVLHPAPQVRSPESLLYPYVGDVLAWWPMDGEPAIQADDVIETFDDFASLTITDPFGGDPNGNAFGTSPSRGSTRSQDQFAIEGERFGEVTGFRGLGFANSYQFESTLAQATGLLRTKTFTITEDYVALLIGGSQEPGACAANLIVNDSVVATATGNDRNELEWHYWEVAAHRGQSARVEIVDQSSTGFIMADELRQTSRAELKDVSSHVSHGHRFNGLTVGEEPGPVNGALAFDGIDDYARVEVLPCPGIGGQGHPFLLVEDRFGGAFPGNRWAGRWPLGDSV